VDAEDRLMPIFTAIGLGIASVVGATGIAATFITGAVTVVGGLGLSYAVQALTGNAPQQQETASRVGGLQGKLRAGGEVPRSFPLGISATDGSLVYANYWGNDGETPNAFLTQVIAVSDLPIPGLRRVFVNGQQVTLDTSGTGIDAGAGGETLVLAAFQAAIIAGLTPFGNTAAFAAFMSNYINSHGGSASGPALERGWPVLEFRKDGKDHLWVKFYDGRQTTADPFVVSRVQNSERPWGVDCVGKGVAYCICTNLVNDTLFTSFPTFRFELEPIPLYDPSRDDTAGGSGAHRWSAPATWGGDGDNLPAVQTYNLMRGFSYEGQWLYGLQNLPAARLPLVSWINAINACRSPIAGENGLEPSYRAGHECLVSTVFADTIELLMTACHGKMAEIGGSYKMRAGPPGAPVLSFTDSDIIVSESQEYQPFLSLDETVTGIVATYPEPEEGWQPKEAPALFRPEFEATAASRKLLASPAFDAIPYAAQVQRLMRSALLDAQRERGHTHTMPPHWYQVEPLDVVEWTSARNGYEEKLFEVSGMVDQPSIDPLVRLKETDPTDYSWNHNIDFSPVSRSPISFVRPAPQGMVDWTAEGVVVSDVSGFKRRAAILLSWDGNQDDVAGVAWQVRDASGLLVHQNRTDDLAEGAVIISQNILPNETYFVRGRYLPIGPRDTLWSEDIPVTTPDVRQSLAEFEGWITHQVTTLQDQFRDEIQEFKAALSMMANQDARNWNDKQIVKRALNSRTDKAFAEISEVLTVATSTEAALASYQLTVAAEFETTNANVTTNANAFASLNTAFGDYQLTVNASLGELNASVTTQASAITTLEGYAGSAYTVTLDVNGYVSGMELMNGGGGISTATFYTTVFRIVNPGFGPKAVFSVGTINGNPSIGIAANVYLDGTMHARAIEAGTVDALQLKQDGVTLDKIVANAMTKPWQVNLGSSIRLNHESEAVLLSRSINCPAASVLSVMGALTYQSGLGGFSDGTRSYTTAGENYVLVRLYVDGAIVDQREYVPPKFYNAGPGFNVECTLPQRVTAPIVQAVSVTAGVHTVEVRAFASLQNGSTGGTLGQGPTFNAGGFTVIEQRKSTLN
jgi:hypothetical protein